MIAMLLLVSGMVALGPARLPVASPAFAHSSFGSNIKGPRAQGARTYSAFHAEPAGKGRLWLNAYIYIYTCGIYTYVCICVRICTCIYIYMCVRMHHIKHVEYSVMSYTHSVYIYI